MGRDWAEQPRDRRGRWRTDKPRQVRLDLRLSGDFAADLAAICRESGLTKTRAIEAAVSDFARQIGAKRGENPVQDMFTRHAQQLRRARRRA